MEYLYSKEKINSTMWLVAEIMLVFLSFPNISTSNLYLDLVEAYPKCGIGAVKWCRHRAGYIICALGNKKDFRKLASAWAQNPRFDDALIIPSNNLGKDILAPVLPLPAVLLRQVPLTGVQHLLEEFLPRMQKMISSGDPTMFPQDQRISMIKQVIRCQKEVEFSNVTIVRQPNERDNQDTAVLSIALHPNSIKDFRNSLNTAAIVGGDTILFSPFADHFWIRARGHFDEKGRICHWCGSKQHSNRACKIGKEFQLANTQKTQFAMLEKYGVDEAAKAQHGFMDIDLPELPRPRRIVETSDSKMESENEMKTEVRHLESENNHEKKTEERSVAQQDIRPQRSDRVDESATSTSTTPNPRPNKLFKQSTIEDYVNKEVSKYGALGGQRGGGQTKPARVIDSQTLFKSPSGHFAVIPTIPDGNCFFHAVNHALSPVVTLLPNIPPRKLRSKCIEWGEQNPGSVILIHSLVRGEPLDPATALEHDKDQIKRCMYALQSDRRWVGALEILIFAATFNIDVEVLSPEQGYNMHSSEVLQNISLLPNPRGKVTILFHQYGKNPNSANQLPDHFSLLLREDPLEFTRKRRRLVRLEDKKLTAAKQQYPNLENEQKAIKAVLQSRQSYREALLGTAPSHSAVNSDPQPPKPKILPLRGAQDIPKSQNVTLDRGVSIVSWNANSLRSVTDGRLKSLMTKTPTAQFFCIQETQTSSPHQPQGFNLEARFDGVRPRGILTLIRDEICYTRRRDIEHQIDPLETIVVEIHAPRPWLLINCYFNPCSKEVPDVTLVNSLSYLLQLQSSFLLCGDLNSPRATRVDPTLSSSHRGNILDEFLFENAKQVSMVTDFGATFFRGDVRSSLDAAISSSDISGLFRSRLLSPIGLGHLPFITEANLPFRKYAIPELASPWFNQQTDWIQLYRSLGSAPEVPSFSNVEDVRRFVEHIGKAQQESSRTIHRHNNQGWWNKRCRQAILARNRVLKKLYKLPPNSPRKQSLREKYTRVAKLARQVITEEKQKWKEEMLYNAGRHSGKAWKAINRICGNKYKRKGQASNAARNRKAQVLAEELCVKFESIQKDPNLEKLLETSPEPFTSPKQASGPPLEEWEIEQAIESLKDSSSPGADNIRVSTLKRIWRHPEWRPVLLSLFSAMYKDPMLFSPFKHGLVHPILKPDGESYRPISLLSQIGKVLERVIARRMQKVLHIPLQFGCSPKRSARDALVRLQNWAVHAEYGAISIFFDISKAYDRVLHPILLRKVAKLKDMDSATFSWVRHFLTERTFQVRVNGTVSDYIARPSHGLPQGSPLSVVLWKVFVIDIPMWNNDNLYMDDLNYNVDEGTFDEAEEEANRRLSILNDWAKENGVLFDKKKTKVLVHEQHVDIELRFSPTDMECIPQVDQYKYLGTWIASRNDKDRGFSMHLQYQTDKAAVSERLRWIKALAGGSMGLRRMAYISLIRSKMAYSLLLTIRNYDEELEKMQTKALQVVSLAPRSTPGYKLRELLNIPTMLELAHDQARAMRCNMLASGGPLANDYERWLRELEGYRSDETPFGLVQSSTLVDDPQLWFESYRHISRKMCSTAYSLRSIYIPSASTLSLLRLSHQGIFATNANEIFCFCDGGFSRPQMIGSTGLVVLTESGPFQGGSKYYPVTSSFQSEVLALRDLSLLLLVKFKDLLKNRSLRIFTDSLSLVRSIKNWVAPWTNFIEPIKADILDNLTFISRISTEISLEWIPGHSGMTGNELADQEASFHLNRTGEAVRIAIDQPFFKMPPANIIVSHAGSQQSQTHTGLLLTYRGFTIRRKDLFQLHGQKGASIARIIMDHHYLRGCHWLRHKGKRSNDYFEKVRCRWCHTSPETVEHVLYECSSVEVYEAREKLLFRLNRRGLLNDQADALLLELILAKPKHWRFLVDFFSMIGSSP
jgi:ribonuclease HI